MPAKAATKSPAFYQKVDQEFYDEVKKENGGKLPANLTDADGNPRKLTMSPEDRAYRQEWKAIAAKTRNSKAIAKKSVESAFVPCAAKAADAKIPAVMAPSKKMGKPVKVGKVEPAPEPAPAPPKKTAPVEHPCKHETLVVECNHEARGFKLQLPAAPSAEGADQFEVIDDGHEMVTCTTKIAAGPCGETHKGKVFDIYPADSVKTQTDDELVFRANYEPDLKSNSFPDLFPLTKSRSPQSLKVTTNTCQQDTLSATVLVYPQVDWALDISLGYAGKYSGDDDERSSELKFSGKVSVTVQGLKKEFGVEIQHEINQALKFADMACKTAQMIGSVTDDLGGVEVAFDYPALSFSGTWGWREIEGSPKCGYGYTWKLGFSPLIGAEIKVDILSFLITKIPAIGQIVEGIRKAVENEAELAVYFAVEGKVSATFDASKTVGEPSDCSGDLGGELEFTLEGVIKSQQYHFWCFHAGGEAKVGGHATFSADVKGRADGEGPYYQGELKFDGLEIYWVVEGGIGITSDEPPPDDPEYGTPDKGDAGSVHYGDTWTLLPEKTLLDSGKHYFLGEEDGD
jgi:hypothetical protein